MSAECKNCKANPVTDAAVILTRINPKGVAGEWVCNSRLNDMELFEGQPHYVHSNTCPNYCDYACNGNDGFDLAEQIAKHAPKNLP